MNNTRLQDDKTHCKYKYRDTAVTGTVCMRVSKIGNRTRTLARSRCETAGNESSATSITRERMIETNRLSHVGDGQATKCVYSTHRSNNTIVHLPMWPTHLVQRGIAIIGSTHSAKSSSRSVIARCTMSRVNCTTSVCNVWIVSCAIEPPTFSGGDASKRGYNLKYNNKATCTAQADENTPHEASQSTKVEQIQVILAQIVNADPDPLKLALYLAIEEKESPEPRRCFRTEVAERPASLDASESQEHVSQPE